MNTSQGGVVSYALYALVYVVGVRLLLRRTDANLRAPSRPAIALWLVVAVPSVLGLLVPAVYGALSRQPDAILHGQVWRLVTSVLVQDDGVTGTLYNLITLALTATVAVRVWRSTTAIVLLLLGGIGFDLVATFAWHAAGGGNSAATFFLLAASLGAVAVRDRDRAALTTGAVTVAAGIVLLAIDDAHGTAVLAGALVGLLVATIPGPTRAGADTSTRR